MLKKAGHLIMPPPKIPHFNQIVRPLYVSTEMHCAHYYKWINNEQINNYKQKYTDCWFDTEKYWGGGGVVSFEQLWNFSD